jgi:DNA modification methylase
VSGRYVLHLGDCLDAMRGMADNSIDAIVTDPPYGLSFMGKKWDYDVPSVEIWAECLRVLKPGGHLLAFAGTRTQHRMAVRIEDAGFEIRDMIAWVYGSGFPKSMDVSKAIDRVRDWSIVERLNTEIKRAREAEGLSLRQIGVEMLAATGGQYGTWYHRGGHMFFETGRSLPSRPEWEQLRRVLPISTEFQGAYDEAEREVIGRREMRDTSEVRIAVTASADDYDASARRTVDITAPGSDAARQWQGWGTALKPALEPITVARKPLIGTVAANVLEHGTGAINIDGSQVMNDGEAPRFPANFIHDGSPEVVALFPQSNGAGGSVPNVKVTGYGDGIGTGESAYLGGERTKVASGTGSAARFFYAAKASRRDRHEGLDDPGAQFKHGTTLREVESTDTKGNNHPTVKPTDLMAYLCRLVTPPGGVVLDPFMGSGSTAKAAMREGFRFIGCEMSEEYLDIARARIEHELAQACAPTKPSSSPDGETLDLFANDNGAAISAA